MNEWILVLLFIVMAFLGLPLFAVMGGLGLVLFHIADIEMSAVIIEMYRVAKSPTLVSIPLFTVAGYLLAYSQTPQRLITSVKILFGNRAGLLSLGCLALCSIFTAFTGASGVTIVALGGLLFPILQTRGIGESYSYGFITVTGSLGLLLPPSLPLILYGVVSKVSIDQLFISGILPCLLLVALLTIYSIYKEKTTDHEVTMIADAYRPLKDRLRLAFDSSKYEFPLPILVLAGIYLGVITTTEAATFTLVYSMLLVFVIRGDLKFSSDFGPIIKESMALVGSILIILACALGLTNYLIDSEVPQKIFGPMRELIQNKWIFLVVLNLFLLVVGCLMDIFSAIIVILPMIIPLAESYGIHPVHLAMIFLTNLEIGYLTPPVGINLFISSNRFKRPLLAIYKDSFPFLLVLMLGLLIITYVPYISLVFVK
ncbi:MAG: TRAP transporter large permease subunit [Bacteriovoracaceae bacterium]|nr:TRAP transporter large permease subunit [Bacteriovoracaceae bacterium]